MMDDSQKHKGNIEEEAPNSAGHVMEGIVELTLKRGAEFSR